MAFEHVKSHTGGFGNEVVDAVAKVAANSFFDIGPPVDIHPIWFAPQCVFADLA